MNPNYTESEPSQNLLWLLQLNLHVPGVHDLPRFKFPQIKPHPWHKVFRSRTSQEAPHF